MAIQSVCFLCCKGKHQGKPFLCWGNLGVFKGRYISCLAKVSLLPAYYQHYSKRGYYTPAPLPNLKDIQNEIGRRNLQLPKYFSGKTVGLALQWPSMSTRMLICKLAFLCKLVFDFGNKEKISKEIFSSLASAAFQLSNNVIC